MPAVISSKRIMRKNRACQPCRARKVKCDGLQPICDICCSQNRACTYNQDRRQISRVSRETIVLLETRLARVEDTVQRLGQDYAQPSRQYLSTFSGDADLSPPSPVAFGRQFSPRNDTAASVSSLSRTSTYVEPDSQDHVPYIHGGDEGIEESGVDSVSIGAQSHPVKVHALVQKEGRTAVYGPSSTFRIESRPQSHRGSSPTENSNAQWIMPQSPREEQDEMVAATRDRIFAYAALERQKEWTYMTERKFDLDGLHFDMAWHLLQLHWNHHHLAYLLTYRPALMHSLATDGPYINKLLLNAIYLSSALSSDRKELLDDINDRQSLGQRFYRRFQQLLLPELERSSIASAVALLTVGSSLVSSGRQTAGWHYSGLGYRMIVDLGLHVSTDQIHTPDPLFLSPKQFEMTEVDQEIRRRVFWGAYINDKFQSLYFGRPPALVTMGIEPSRSFLDTYDELDTWTPYRDTKTTGSSSSHYTPQPAYAISTFNSFIDLADIMADIVEQIYSPKVRLISKEKALHEAARIQHNLELWANSLPSHLLYDPKNDLPPPAHRFNPPMCFHMLHILLHRPFLPQGHLQHFSLDEKEPRRICRSAAFQIYELAKSYRRAYTLRRATYMFSYALFSAASIVAFKASETEPTDSMLQKEVAGFLWAALKELQNGANFGLSKPMMIIRSLFEHSGLNLEAITSQQSYHRDLAPPTNPQQYRSTDQNNQAVDLEVHDHGAGSPGGTEFETMFRDLISGAFDGVMNMGEPNLNEDSNVLYGLFR